jgi:hypothetical protein
MILLAELAAMAVFLAEQPARSQLQQPRTPPSLVANSLTKQTTDARSEARDAELYFASCMTDWDAATHMTRREWEKTCRRVANNRAKFKHQNQLDPSAQR